MTSYCGSLKSIITAYKIFCATQMQQKKFTPKLCFADYTSASMTCCVYGMMQLLFL